MIQQKSAQQGVSNSKILFMDSVAALRSCAVTIAALGAVALYLATSTPALAATACCKVTVIAANGQVTAQEINGTRTLAFQVTDAALLRALKPGAPVFANFETNQVSLDGKRACCKILSTGTAAQQPGPVATAAPSKQATTAEVPKVEVTTAAGGTVTSATDTRQPVTASNTVVANAQSVAINPNVILSQALPQLSFGTWQNVKPTNLHDGPKSLLQFQNKQVIQLRGMDDIKKATGLPQAAKDMLWLHARTLEAQELDGYIVIPEKAQEWSLTLPDSVREKLRKAAEDDGKKKKKGCSSNHISMGCVQTEVDQAVDDFTKAARKAWDDIEAEWGRLVDNLGDAQKCFADHPLKAKFPVKFSISPQIPVSFERDGTQSSKSGSASGSVTGTVTVGVPVAVDSIAELQAFYIPCMPFAIRPRSIGASGDLDAGGDFHANVVASGEFDRLFTIPPSGGVQIPVAVVPIVLGGFPIAILDVSVYLDGTLQVDGKGKLDGNLLLRSMQKSEFAFECSGHGCKLDKRSVPAPATAVESVQLDGRIRIKPAIYTALQLGLNINLLVARAGPQPYLLGQVHGCGTATAEQNTDGTSSSQDWYALAADLDWGIELRAEALAGGQKVAKKIWSMKEEHLYFKDLVNSTAFVPIITGTNQPSLGQPAMYTMKMPTCYLYPDTMNYRVQWSGGAIAGAATSAAKAGMTQPGTAIASSAPSSCSGTSAPASCTGAPTNDTVIYLSWPAAGSYNLTVAPREDSHGRNFGASRAAELSIEVQP